MEMIQPASEMGTDAQSLRSSLAFSKGWLFIFLSQIMAILKVTKGAVRMELRNAFQILDQLYLKCDYNIRTIQQA